MRLIDADALLERFKSMKLNCKASYAIAKYIGKIVFEISESTVDICSEEVKRSLTVDAVEVVRCKDCKQWDKETGWCNQHSSFIDDSWEMFDENDFCSYGDRKEDGI